MFNKLSTLIPYCNAVTSPIHHPVATATALVTVLPPDAFSRTPPRAPSHSPNPRIWFSSTEHMHGLQLNCPAVMNRYSSVYKISRSPSCLQTNSAMHIPESPSVVAGLHGTFSGTPSAWFHMFKSSPLFKVLLHFHFLHEHPPGSSVQQFSPL